MAVYKKVPGHTTVNISTLEFDTKPTKGSLNPVTSDGISTQSDNIAEAFSASSTYAIGEVVIGPDGKLYQCTTAVETAGEWDPANWTQTTVAEAVGAISDVLPEGASAENKLVDQATLDEATAAWSEGYTPKGPASVSTLNGLSGQENGDRYVLTDGGTLTDGSLTVAAGDEVAWDGTGEKWYLVGELGKTSIRVDELSAVELKNWGLNSYYATNGAIGSTVTMTPTQGNTKSLVVSCKAGDKFLVKGVGGSTSRLWCFVDSSDKIVSQSASSVTSTVGIPLEATVDGKLIVNSANSATITQVISFVSSNVYPLYSKTAEDCKTLSTVEKTDWVNESYIKTNLNYGNTVDLTPIASTSYRHMVVDCVAGDEVYVKANGGDAPRSWAYIDSSNKLVSGLFSGIGQSTLLKISAPVDGKLIINDNMQTPLGLVLVSNATAKQEMLSNLDTRVTAIENELPPNTVFEVEHDLPNVASYISGFDYSTTAMEKTILEQVYTAFDSLVTDYPDYVSRVDAAEEADIEYPEYANGYDGVPAYKMYMYKFVSSFAGAGNTNGANPKKKLFIIAGVHGDETAAPADSFIFAKKLCEASEENFFKLRTCYDVYIIPCVNGFGLHKLTRVNGNGVDINRNYPIDHWTVHGNPGDSTYSGPSAGSEFETQVVCAMFNDFAPDIAIDHHNYSDDNGGQFYMAGGPGQKFLQKIAHRHLEDCSFTFIKDLPTCFGTSYQLFRKNNTSNLPASLDSYNDATSVVWFKEAGATCSVIIEISRTINYNNGEAVTTGSNIDLYGEDTFSVGQYTFAGMVFKVAGYIIGK